MCTNDVHDNGDDDNDAADGDGSDDDDSCYGYNNPTYDSDDTYDSSVDENRSGSGGYFT